VTGLSNFRAEENLKRYAKVLCNHHSLESEPTYEEREDALLMLAVALFRPDIEVTLDES